MDVNTVNQVNIQTGYISTGTRLPNQVTAGDQLGENAKAEQGSSADDNAKDKKALTKEELSHITYEMNKFLQLINTNIQFVLHDKTKQIIVQVVDTRDNRVLKEFPPHEMLDTLAKISDYIGLLLDKKA